MSASSSTVAKGSGGPTRTRSPEPSGAAWSAANCCQACGRSGGRWPIPDERWSARPGRAASEVEARRRRPSRNRCRVRRASRPPRSGNNRDESESPSNPPRRALRSRSGSSSGSLRSSGTAARHPTEPTLPLCGHVVSDHPRACGGSADARGRRPCAMSVGRGQRFINQVITYRTLVVPPCRQHAIVLSQRGLADDTTLVGVYPLLATDRAGRHRRVQPRWPVPRRLPKAPGAEQRGTRSSVPALF